MALVRILIDGYNLLHAWERYQGFRDNQSYRLLHSWPELARGKARFSSQAREALIQRLTLYQDASQTPVTIFFDGKGAPGGTRAATSKSDVEVIYSRSGQTADDLIERAAYRFRDYGEVLAVTDDSAERETVLSLGGLASSCLNFIQTVESVLAETGEDLKHYNRQERQRFRSGTGPGRNRK